MIIINNRYKCCICANTYIDMEKLLYSSTWLPKSR